MKKKYLSIILAVLLITASVFTFTSCEEVSTAEYPADAPYADIPELENYSSSTSYSSGFRKTTFKGSIKWKPEESYTATYTDDFYIQWAQFYGAEPELVQPSTDKPKSNGKEYNIKPGEKVTFNFDIDKYYEDLPADGIYTFVKVIKVNEDGTFKKYLVHFDLDFTSDDDTTNDF